LAPLWERAAALRRTYDAQIAAVPQPSGSEVGLEKIAAAREGITATTQRIANLLGGHNFELPLYETDTIAECPSRRLAGDSLGVELTFVELDDLELAPQILNPYSCSNVDRRASS
jgi:hypothetical protein